MTTNLTNSERPSVDTDITPSINNSSNNASANAKFYALAPLIMCTIGAVFYCYEYYLRVAPSVMRSDLMVTYNIGDSALGYLLAYYYWAYVPLQIPAGLLMDKYGPRISLTWACFVCAIGTYFFAGSESLLLAKIGRFLVGAGSAFAYVGVLKIANLWLPRKYFALVAGICTALGTFGAMAGQILPAKIVDHLGWRTTLYSSAFIGILLSFVLFFLIKNRQPGSEAGGHNHDKANSKNKNINSKNNDAVRENSTSNWRQDLLELGKSKTMWINGILGCLTYLPLTIFAEVWAPTFLETVGLTKEHAAWASSVMFFGFGIGGPIWGLVSDKIKSRRKPLYLGTLIAAITSVWFIFWPPANVWLLCLVMLICGICASAQILVFAIGNDICRPEMSATTVAFTNMLVMLGGMLLQPLVGSILDILPNAGTQLTPILGNFKIALSIMPAGLVLSLILIFIMKETYRSSDE